MKYLLKVLTTRPKCATIIRGLKLFETDVEAIFEDSFAIGPFGQTRAMRVEAAIMLTENTMPDLRTWDDYTEDVILAPIYRDERNWEARA